MNEISSFVKNRHMRDVQKASVLSSLFDFIEYV